MFSKLSEFVVWWLPLIWEVFILYYNTSDIFLLHYLFLIHHYNYTYMSGDPKNHNLLIKNCVFILTFKLQPLSKHSPFDAIHPLRRFSTAPNSFWTHWFWWLLVLFAVFHFTSSTSAKHFPLRIFFIGQTKENVTWGKIRWLEKGGHRGHAIFGQKLLNTQCHVGRCACKWPTMK